MTKVERMSMRRELFEQSKLCCWCGKELCLQPLDRSNLATIEHHFSAGEVALACHGCNR